MGLGDKLLELLANIFIWMWRSFIAPFVNIPSIQKYVFGYDGQENELALSTFKPSELVEVYVPVFNIFMVLAGFMIILSLVNAGMRISGTVINPASRISLVEYMKDLVLIALLLANLGTFYAILFEINSSIIGLFKDAYNQQIDLFMMDPLDNKSELLGKIALGLVLLGLTIWASFYYTMRKVTLLILMGMGPLFLAFFLFPQTKGITGAWLRELTGTIFVQSVHAALFFIIATMSTSSEAGIIESLLLFIIFIPIGEAVKGLLGLGTPMTNGMQKAGAAFGLSALAGMYGAAKGAWGDKPLMQALKDSYNGAKDKIKDRQNRNNEGETSNSSIASNTGTDKGSTSLAEKMLKAGQISSKAGKAVFGMAGSLVGSPMGPAGAIALATVGAEIGDKAGGFTGRTLAATTHGVGNRLKKGLEEGKKGFNDVHKGNEDRLIDEMAKAETNMWANQNREQFEKDFMERFPDAHKSDLSKAWNQELSNKKPEFKKKAEQQLGKLKELGNEHARGTDLSNMYGKEMGLDWEANGDNRDTFNRNWRQNNPPSKPIEQMSEKEKGEYFKKQDDAWKSHVDSAKGQIQGIADSVTDRLTGGDTGKLINKKEYAKIMAEEVLEFEKKMGQSLGAPLSSDLQDKRLQELKNDTNYYANETSGPSVIGNGKANRDFMVSGLAKAKTDQDRETFMNEAKNNGTPKEEAQAQWQSQQNNVYQKNREMFDSNLSSRIPLSRLSNISNGTLKDIAAAGSFATNFALGTTGLSALANSDLVQRTGQAITIGTAGFLDGASTGFNSNGNLITKGVETVTGAFSGGGAGLGTGWSLYSSENANPVASQASFRDSVAYVGGVLGGVRGYEIGSNLGTKINPHNSKVEQQLYQPSELQHLAHTYIDPSGSEVLSPGAIRMVTTSDGTHIEVRSKSGQSHQVSRIGSGHSGLKSGQTVYQDLMFGEDGQLQMNSTPYQLDSSGGRYTFSESINVNPNKLLAKPSGVQTQNHSNFQPFNQAIDSGHFTSSDIRKQMRNVELITESDKSYVVGTSLSDGKQYRVSVVGPGDPRLQQGQVVKQKVIYRNNRMVLDKISHSVNGNDVHTSYFSSLNVDDLVPTKVNPRLEKRKVYEQKRRPTGIV
ncbi:type IV secretion system protein [Bacillus salitolerans]|uniref:Type IV secretion system protein n=1 Tax=Bacillus salitolerans TaxID=1437434 RepID=A0ABW4LMZ8_9BACI